MNVMIHQQAEREAELMQANREELVERIGRAIREDGTTQPLPGLHLYRRSSTASSLHGVSRAVRGVIAQGSKEVLLGESRYRYDPFTVSAGHRRSAHHPSGSSKPRRSGPTSVCAWNSPPPLSARSCLRPVMPRLARSC